jgi:hypothetical protein
LREIDGDRPDLLAEVTGILLGASEGELDEPRAEAAASFCIAAGADESLIRDGSRRAAAGSRSGGNLRSATRPDIHRGAADGLQDA